jgi:hypothetical protein
MIYFIGGAARVGKTTLAQQLSQFGGGFHDTGAYPSCGRFLR